jgi:ABC-2 type transport system ATP-binding protein
MASTGCVDPLSRRRFWRLINDLAGGGTTVLVTTHYLDEAENCHRVAIIDAGRLAALGTVPELKQVFAGRPIVEVRSTQPVDAMRRLEAMPEVEKTSIFGTAVHAVMRASDVRPDAITAALGAAGIQASSRVVDPSLEDVFLDIAEKSAQS